jgi:hypothetical protein
MIFKYIVSIVAFLFCLSSGSISVSAQTMDPAQIVSQLLSQYQNELEGQDVEKSLGNVGDMSKLSGLPGKAKDLKSFKKLGGDFMKGTSLKTAPLVPKEISNKMGDVKKVQKFAKEKMMPKVDSLKGQSSAKRKEANDVAKTVQQVTAVESYGNAVSSQELAKEASKAEDENTKEASSSNTARDNTKMLTAMTIQSIKILSQIKSLEALRSGSDSVNTMMMQKNVDEKASRNSKAKDKGSW